MGVFALKSKSVDITEIGILQQGTQKQGPSYNATT